MGRRRELGVEAFAGESWKSVGGEDVGEDVGEEALCVLGTEGGVGVTTSSRHWGVLGGLEMGNGPVGVCRVCGASYGFGSTD